MITEIIANVYSILIIVLFLDTVVCNIFILIHAIKKYKNKQPKNLEYYIKKCYGHFEDDTPSKEEAEEDIQILSDMIEKLKNQLEAQKKIEY